MKRKQRWRRGGGVTMACAFELLAGTACLAPYVECVVTALTGKKSATFKSRIDTGADLTTIPAAYIDKLKPLLQGRPVLIRSGNGTVERERTYKAGVTVDVDGQPKTFYPSRGVLLRDGDRGLLGMDILNDLDFGMRDGKFTLTTKENHGNT